jgi:hypothetical protein
MDMRNRDLFIVAVPIVGIPLVTIGLLWGLLWAYTAFGAVLAAVGIIGTIKDSDRRAKQYVETLIRRSRAIRPEEV